MVEFLSNVKKSRKYLRKDILYSPAKLINIRKNRNLNREDVVKQTGLSYDELYLLENGKVSPQLNTMVILAELYNCCIGEFLIKQPYEYCHCTKLEKQLILAIRKYPNFDLARLIDLLNDQSEKANKVRLWMRNIMELPDSVLDSFSNLGQQLILHSKQKQEVIDDKTGESRQLNLPTNNNI